jgi:hypothetical protein
MNNRLTKINDVLDRVYLNLQNLQEKKKNKLKKKKADGMRSVRKGADKNPKVTRMDFLPDEVLNKISKEKSLDEFVDQLDEKKKSKKKKSKVRKKATSGEKSYRAQQYGATKKGPRSQAKFARASYLYKIGDVKGAAAIRDKMELQEGNQSKLDRDTLKEMIEEILQFEMLENFMIEMDVLEDVDELMLNERKKRRKRKSKKKAKSKGGGFSAAVKKSLDKKADKRCLTRGSVYSEFRKGLAAFLSSGSRKGMSAHQWAHARVNSANPSKSWASVKKRKKCPKKKKK